MNKLLMILVLLASYTQLFAKSKNPLILCLGKEEQIFHQRKISPPDYHLNKKMLQVLLANPNINQNEYFICKKKPDFRPAFKLLEELSLSMGAFTNFIKRTTLKNQKRLKEDLLSILNDYINNIQKEAPTAKCLNSIREIKKLQVSLQYLHGEIPLNQLLPDREEMQTIFDQIRNPIVLYKSCRKKAKRSARH